MRNNRIAVLFCMLLVLPVLLAACGGTAAKTTIEMELTADYDVTDPFVHEKLFYVTGDMDALDLDATFQMTGESGMLEIADNDTGQVFWSNTWTGEVEETEFIILLDAPKAETEYVIRFTGTKIDYAKIVITTENSLAKERERPLHPDRS